MDEARNATRKAAEWTARRNQAIRAARAEGRTFRQIASATGLPLATVHAITKGASDGRS